MSSASFRRPSGGASSDLCGVKFLALFSRFTPILIHIAGCDAKPIGFVFDFHMAGMLFVDTSPFRSKN